MLCTRKEGKILFDTKALMEAEWERAHIDNLMLEFRDKLNMINSMHIMECAYCGVKSPFKDCSIMECLEYEDNYGDLSAGWLKIYNALIVCPNCGENNRVCERKNYEQVMCLSHVFKRRGKYYIDTHGTEVEWEDDK